MTAVTTIDSGRREQAGEGQPRRPVLHSWAASLRHDVDEVVIARLMEGLTVEHYTAWERRIAVCRLRQAGATYFDIIDRLRIDMRQVGRDLRYANEVA